MFYINNPAFLWISGWSVSSNIWKEYACSWTNVDHYFLDFNHDSNILQLAEDAIDVIPNKQLHVIAWSLGAMVILDLLSLGMDKIRSCYLISAVASFVKSSKTPLGPPNTILLKMKRLLDRNIDLCISSFDKWIVPNTNHLGVWQNKVRYNCTYSLPALVAGLDYLSNFNIYDKLDNIRIPIRLFAGANDKICPLDSVESLSNHLQDASLKICQRSGHAPFWLIK